MSDTERRAGLTDTGCRLSQAQCMAAIDTEYRAIIDAEH